MCVLLQAGFCMALQLTDLNLEVVSLCVHVLSHMGLLPSCMHISIVSVTLQCMQAVQKLP